MGYTNARQSVRAALKSSRKEKLEWIPLIDIQYPNGKMKLNTGAIFHCLLIPKYRMQNIINVISMDTEENKINNLKAIDTNLSILKAQLEENPDRYNKTQRKYLENNHALIKKTLA